MSDARAPGSGKVRSGGPGSGVKLAALGFGVTLALVVLETALRLVPQAISPKLLILFEPGLRAAIASGAYPLQKDFQQIERDDGGPPLFVAKPDTRIVSIDDTPDGAVRSTDEIGFCNPPGRYNGHERIDVITLGDSFTWCHAVVPEQAWPALLGERAGLSTFSLGRGGNGPYEYLQYFRRFGIPKHPRVVVMNIYGGNDLRDAVSYGQYTAAIEKGEEPPSETPRNIAPGLAASLVGRHSYSLNLVLAFVSRIASQDPSDWERTGIDFRYQLALSGGPVAFNTENRDRDEVVSARHLASGSTPVTIWDAALARFAALAREQGFTAIVSYTPSAYVAYGDRVRFADPSIATSLLHLDDAQRRYLAERASSLGILFHDLTAALREASQHPDETGLLYHPVHVHLTARGNEVVAASLARFLDERGLDRDAQR